MSDSPILPGATLGVLGSGQLGRMFAIAARRMGYRVHVLSPDDDTPTGQVADVEINAAYDDLDAVRAFVQNVDVLTFEFENVPASAAELAAEYVPVRPAGRILYITQNRRREKTFLRENGFPTAPFELVDSLEALRAAAERLGTPVVAKTAGFGYDGKGQYVLHSPQDADAAWAALNTADVVVEGFVNFRCELSVVVARSLDSRVVTYGPMRNDHRNHILDVSVAPAGVDEGTASEARRIATALAETFGLVGVLCVELFLSEDGRLLVNEIAPRPHNSGHLTIDAHVTCQFEQQVRAVCGLALGSPRQHTPAAMANLLGDLWSGGTPRWEQVTRFPEVKLHLYGKREARPGRKMGHLTALAATAAEAERLVRQARGCLEHESLVRSEV